MTQYKFTFDKNVAESTIIEAETDKEAVTKAKELFINTGATAYDGYIVGKDGNDLAHYNSLFHTWKKC